MAHVESTMESIGSAIGKVMLTFVVLGGVIVFMTFVSGGMRPASEHAKIAQTIVDIPALPSGWTYVESHGYSMRVAGRNKGFTVRNSSGTVVTMGVFGNPKKKSAQELLKRMTTDPGSPPIVQTIGGHEMWMSTDTLGNKKVGIVTLNNGWAVDIKVGREGFGAVDLASAQPFFNSIRRFVE